MKLKAIRILGKEIKIWQLGIVLALTAALAAVSVFALLSLKKPAAKPDSVWAEHIKAHTSGEISKNSTIKVIFNNDLISGQEIESDATKLFHFSPSLRGKAVWSAQNEIIFTPDAALPAGKEYTVTLKLSQFIHPGAGVADYFFKFRVIKQDFDINFEGFRFPDLKDLSTQEYHGRVSTADDAENEAVEKILKAAQKGKSLKINWRHSPESHTHDFAVEGIKRGDKASSLIVEWDGRSLDVDKKGNSELEVLPRGVFEVIEANVIFSDTQYISVIFSDPLLQEQNLSGLVYIENNDFRTEIDMNEIRIYPSQKIVGNANLHIEPGVKNSEGKKLQNKFFREVVFQRIDPGVRFVGDGHILPDVENLTIPFEAVNVRSVQVTVLKVYNSNIGQFFQVNSLDSSREIQRVGRYLWRKTINLNATADELSRWTQYNLDVSELYSKHPNSLFQIELSINRSNSALTGEGSGDPAVKEPDFQNSDENRTTEQSYWDYWEDEEISGDWDNKANPFHDAYYNRRFKNPVYSARNFISSNIGIIAKYAAGKSIRVVTTDILTAKPLSASIKIYNYQNILLGEGRGGGDGFADIQISGEGKPFYLVAEHGSDKGFLKLGGEAALTVSHFDVGGETISEGVKGFIYGERGVWRPGDPIYLTFVLEDKENLIPDDHPVVMYLYNPKGQLKQEVTNYRKVNDFYSFQLKTNENDITGSWTAQVRLGGLSFTKTLSIESIVPNRLKITLDMGRKELHRSALPLPVKISSQWLHGASAENLKADLSVSFTSATPSFTRYADYTFEDRTRSVSGDRSEVYSGQLNDKGEASFNLDFADTGTPPGMLTAHLVSRVHEGSGAFSTETIAVPFYPYSSYVGIKLPRGDQARQMLLTDTEHTIKIATVDSFGKNVSRENINITLYKIDWQWWWDKSGDSLANFTSSQATQQLQSGTIATRNGSGAWKFSVKYPDWGRYLIRVEDPVSGHSASQIVYIDWPGWAGRAREEKGTGATRLNFTADKEKYNVGETAVIYLPESENANALISIENGRKIIEQRWVTPSKGKNNIRLPITSAMSPNVYVHVSLIQPHKGKNNDTPLRLYGIIPLLVEDPQNVLRPIVRAPKEIKPKEKTAITVTEELGKKMTYTVAIVDEGLLGLTHFNTPNLKDYFYMREALGVKTWDLYDDIVGGYGGRLNRILALGGGDSGISGEQLRESRFPPVVRFLGPFQLEARGSNTHEFELDPYIGSVRVMVIAGDNGAYGSTEQSVFVRQPLMISATLPRMLGPQEEILIPVSVFSKNSSIRNVSLSIEGGKMISFPEGKNTSVTFSGQGERMAFFKARVGSAIGRTSIKINANGGGESDEQEVFIDIRSPNPPETALTSAVIEPGKSYSQLIRPLGLENSNSAVVEISTLRPINLENRIGYLIRYPHGCLEQTVSSVFPQLYLANLTKLTAEKKRMTEININDAIKKISGFQLSAGGFSFWPGEQRMVNSWAEIYAGHFLIEAQKMGYSVPTSLLGAWKRSQKRQASAWAGQDEHARITQAYRLYVLAAANDPSVPEMNRLRESGRLETAAQWLLAGAYYHAGQRSAAAELTRGASTGAGSYTNPGLTFGSTLRDGALMLMAISEMNQRDKGKQLADQISRELSAPGWLSTQETSFALLAITRFSGQQSASYDFAYSVKLDGRSENASSNVAFATKEIAGIPPEGTPIEITNRSGKAVIYVTITSKGSPAPGKEKTATSGLAMQTSFKDKSGSDIDAASVAQGTDFSVTVSVTNNTGRPIDNIALTHNIPSGWQIHNARFESGAMAPGADYQDFRDGGVYTYFSLKTGETKSFTMMVNASFAGKSYMPSICVEDMYNPAVRAASPGKWVQINR